MTHHASWMCPNPIIQSVALSVTGDLEKGLGRIPALVA